ncbi:hypothetical protein AGMMS49983_14150 [Clostridia bacterium]|nr:hypothetical protein AGMMS49983_14150 [Clostridia bacterium]
MSIKGQLTPDKFGMGMPVHASPYAYGDLAFTGIKRLVYVYYTDPELAASILPSVLELDDKPIANMQFVSYTNSTCGAYTEIIQTLNVSYNGVPGVYAVALYVSNDMAMMAREKFGIPKMLGFVDFKTEDSNSIVATFDRPAGVMLAQGVFSAKQYIGEFKEEVDGVSYALRFLPPLIPGEKPDVCQLVRMASKTIHGEVWEGSGTLTYTGRNDEHPLHKLPVVEMIKTIWTPDGKFFMYPSKNEAFPLV